MLTYISLSIYRASVSQLNIGLIGQQSSNVLDDMAKNAATSNVGLAISGNPRPVSTWMQNMNCKSIMFLLLSQTFSPSPWQDWIWII